MKKFEIAGVEYRFNEETGRYSKVEGGKTKRIGKAEYEEAASTPINVKRIPSEKGDHMVEFAKIGTDYGVRNVGEEEYHFLGKDEIKTEPYRHDKGQKFTPVFEFMGRRYWLMDAVEKGKTEKKRAKRKPKDIAYENAELSVTLTAKQLDFIKHSPDTCFWEKGLDSNPWVDVLCDEIGGQFANKPMTVGAMVSTLREKGIIDVCRDDSRKGKPKYLWLTEKGKAVFTDLEVGI